MARTFELNRAAIIASVSADLVGVSDSKIAVLVRDYCKTNSIPATKLDIDDIANEIMRQRTPASFAFKAVDQEKTSDASLADDDDLVLPVTTYTDYKFEMVVIYESAATGIQYKVTVPSNATIDGIQTTVVDNTTDLESFYEDTTYTLGNSLVDNQIVITGVLRVTDTSGDVAFQWAQQTSNASGTGVLKPSNMTLTKLV